MAIDSVSAASAAQNAPAAAPLPSFNDSDGPSFSDILDILNPLQHIPIINTIYQHLTGDSEGAVADVAGGTLWAGPIGLVASLVDLSMRSDGGQSASDSLLSWLGLGDDPQAKDSAVAQNAAPPAPVVQAQQQAAAVSVAPTLMAVAQPRRGGRDLERSDSAHQEASAEQQDGAPQKKGDYLVFGGAGSGRPAAQPASLAPAIVQAPNDGPQKKGNYLVFGGGGAKAAPIPLTPAVATSASTIPVQTQIAVAPSPQPAPINLTPLPARSFTVPERRTQTAPTALPPPTTGPAAIPGNGPSQAMQNTSDADWFLGAVANNLNKYQAAQKLTESAASGGDDTATLH